MESSTDTSLFEGRLFFRLGEFTHDHRKKVLAFGGLLPASAWPHLLPLDPIGLKAGAKVI